MKTRRPYFPKHTYLKFPLAKLTVVVYVSYVPKKILLPEQHSWRGQSKGVTKVHTHGKL